MGKALYRSYRSTSFDEVIGQDHITTTLKNALAKNRISHAYLLTGPRGVGKTSVARILAYEVNKIPYTEGDSHLDIIEIDAASNRRIDEIREIRERVNIAPTSSQYKVYIIDEVHMLTREAFNALLKTLEEPPAHVIFILATTELHKVPETIISRCLRLTFLPIENNALTAHLRFIADKESIKIDDDALALLAEHARGSFRDSITLLEQVSHHGSSVGLSDVQNMLGLASGSTITDIIKALEKSDLTILEETLQSLYSQGVNEAIFAGQLSRNLRDLLINQATVIPYRDVLSLQHDLLDVAGSTNPRVCLELALFRVVVDGVKQTVPKESPIQQDVATKKTEKKNHKQPERTHETDVAVPKITKKPHSTEVTSSEINENSVEPREDDCWNLVIDTVRSKNNTLYAIARMAEVNETKDEVCLTFTFPFHYKQMNDSKNKAIFNTIMTNLGAGHKTLRVELAKVESVAPETVKLTKVTNLESVSNIFGSHEVLES